LILQIAAVVLSYLLGSVSFSVLIGRFMKGVDVRQHGSGNAGATNTLRVLGKGPAIMVLLLDVCKGIAAVWLGYWLGGGSQWTAALAGIAAIAGHNWPLYFHFRGGKGIATAIGVLATLCFFPALIAGIIAILSIVITRYVSLGSLIFVILTPWMILVLGYSWPLFWSSLIICVFAVWRHRSNIRKLIQGKENRLGSKGGDRLG